MIVSVIVALIFLCVLVYAAYLAMDWLKVPDQLQKLVYLLFFVVFLLVVLGNLGLVNVGRWL